MNVLLVLHSANLNGIFMACLAYAKFLVQQKSADIVLFCPEFKDPLKRFESIGVKVLQYESIQKAIKSIEAQGFKPDFIVRESFFSPNISELAEHFGSKYMVRVHDILPFNDRTDAWYTKHLTADDYFAQCKQGNIVFVGHAVKNYYAELTSKYSVHAYCAYPTIIEEDLVDDRSPQESQPEVFRILQLGTVYKRKGCVETYQAFKRVLNEAQVDLELHFIGDRRSTALEVEYSDNLKKLIKQDGLEIKVRVWPSLQNPHFVLPDYHLLTLHSESECTPLVIFEAFFLGKPVVAPSIGSIPEQVIEGKNGFLFCKGDIARQADRMLSIINEREVWKQKSALIKKIYTDNYSATVQNNALFEIMVNLQ